MECQRALGNSSCSCISVATRTTTPVSALPNLRWHLHMCRYAILFCLPKLLNLQFLTCNLLFGVPSIQSEASFGFSTSSGPIGPQPYDTAICALPMQKCIFEEQCFHTPCVLCLVIWVWIFWCVPTKQNIAAHTCTPSKVFTSGVLW